jgi:hypothetical protein
MEGLDLLGFGRASALYDNVIRSTDAVGGFRPHAQLVTKQRTEKDKEVL